MSLSSLLYISYPHRARFPLFSLDFANSSRQQGICQEEEKGQAEPSPSGRPSSSSPSSFFFFRLLFFFHHHVVVVVLLLPLMQLPPPPFLPPLFSAPDTTTVAHLQYFTRQGEQPSTTPPLPLPFLPTLLWWFFFLFRSQHLPQYR